MDKLELKKVQMSASIQANKIKEIILNEAKQGWTLVTSYNSIQKNAAETAGEQRINLIFKK
jgi:hypothetical protein